MNPSESTAGHDESTAAFWRGREARVRLRWLIATVALVLAAHAVPLVALGRFASDRHELYSHIFLVPFIAGYLAWFRLKEFRGLLMTSFGWGSAAVLAGLVMASASVRLLARGQGYAADTLVLAVGGLLAFIAAAGFFVLGARFMRAVAFPFGFLVFMSPIPSAVEAGIEVFFQHASAATAHVMMKATGLAVVREKMIFSLPGIALEVAAECSGIRSTYMLLLTSLIAGAVILTRASSRIILVLVVVPLGIIRNGFRILTLAQLCVQIGPGMIDSPIHHRGGPIFFALSLIPFVALLLWLRRREKRCGNSANQAKV